MLALIVRGFDFLVERFRTTWGPYLWELLLILLERAAFGSLTLLGIIMEDDDVFTDPLNARNGNHSNHPSSREVEMRTVARGGLGNMGMRSLSLPDVSHEKGTDNKSKHPQQSIMNPVKEFIVNFVNRKAGKKREAEEKPKPSSGRGHGFIPFQLRNPTWCDLCGEFIWGLYKQCVRCKNCKYTCHWRCLEEIDLDCIGSWPQNLARNMSIDEIAMNTLHLLDQDDPKRNEPYMMFSTNISSGSLRRKIDEFNTQTTGLIMTMKDESVFQGFVRVHMNLLRPINIVAGQRPLSIFETVAGSINNKKSTRTSFFLPLGTVKALHVTSETTVQEVIEALLKKFKIADNPRKFALFECYQEQDDHVILRRMADFETPLMLRLLWGGADIRHSFSLQENETGDIVWEVFSIPELLNFLKILDKEEEEHIAMVKEKYKKYKESLDLEMKERRKNKTPSEGSPTHHKST